MKVGRLRFFGWGATLGRGVKMGWGEGGGSRLAEIVHIKLFKLLPKYNNMEYLRRHKNNQNQGAA